MSPHVRPTVAEWLLGASISRRIALFVAVIVTGVVTMTAYVQIRAFESTLDGDLVSAARLAAESVADDLAVREGPLDPSDVRDMLHDLVEADPLVDTISVIETDAAGQSRVLTSTSTEERAEIMDLARRVVAAKSPLNVRSATMLTLAMPVPRRGTYAVAVSVGLESLLQARKHGVSLAAGFAVPAIVLVTLLVYVAVRQLLEGPLHAILGTMEKTAAGDAGARAVVWRHDEFGAIASGLNAMLEQIEQFNQSLQDRIEEATHDLSVRNAQLAASRNELFALRESLAQAERVAALGQVAANVAHQAGTPLNLISGYIQMIRDDPTTGDRTRARLQIVDAQIQQVTRVLRTMLDRAKQPSGFAVMALSDIIEGVREVAQPRLSRSKIQLRTSVADDLPPVRADVTQLEMALLNLVTNALDAMPGGGTLSIAASAHGEGVRIEIGDTGPGIPAEIRARLFDPWVTTKPAGQGTGLGLAIVREVVRAHGGSVSEADRPAGALFVIDLPAAESQRSAP